MHGGRSGAVLEPRTCDCGSPWPGSCVTSGERRRANPRARVSRMQASEAIIPGQVLDTSAGEFRLQEYRFRQGDREWKVFHTGAVLTRKDEARVIGEKDVRLP